MEATVLEARLAEFRAAFSRAELERGGQVWTYWRGGDAGEFVLWLTGALGVGELAFAHALELARDFRVLVPDYPSVSTLDELVDGLVAVLDAEGVASAHVVGGSFGGMVAQHLLRRYPPRVRALVLSHTMAPAPSFFRTPLLRLATRLLPEWVFRWLVGRRLRGSFAAGGPFWITRFESILARLTRADMASRARLAGEFLESDSHDARAWPGRVLIVYAADDPLAPRGDEALRRLFPTAETHVYFGTGHSGPILEPERYVETIRRFLTGPGRSGP